MTRTSSSTGCCAGVAVPFLSARLRPICRGYLWSRASAPIVAPSPWRPMTPIILLLSGLLATPSVPGPARSVERQKNWLELRSPNFRVLGDARAGDIRHVAERLEQFRDAFEILFPNAIKAASRATTVVVFRSQRNFEPFKPQYEGKAQSVAGYFIPGEAVHYIALTTEGDDAFGIIYHEYACTRS